MVTSVTSKKLVYTFENNNDIIVAANVVAKDFLKTAGRRGFGIGKKTVRTIKSAGGGSRVRSVRSESRVIDMPIAIFGDDRQAVEDKLRRFARLLNPDVTAPKLVATYPDGSRVYTEVYYQGGGDPEYGNNTNGETYAELPMSFFAPNPYWTEEDPVEYHIGPANTGRGLIKTGGGGLSRLRVSSSQTLGTVQFENPGDVAAYPVWVITGPADSFQIALPDGTGFSYPHAIAGGEVITVNTQTKKVTNQLGVNKYTNLADAPKFFSVPAGITPVTVLLLNTTSDSGINVYFNPLREAIF